MKTNVSRRLLMTVLVFSIVPFSYSMGYGSLAKTVSEHAQSQEPLGKFYYDHCYTTDNLYWGYDWGSDTMPNNYMIMNRSPLADLKGYESLYPVYGIPMIDGYVLITADKCYDATWCVIDKMLYLCEITIWEEQEMESMGKQRHYPGLELYRIMEQLTKVKFEKNNLTDRGLSCSPLGIMPAIWMTGKLYIKPRYFLSKKSKEWEKIPPQVLTFRNGKLISVEGKDPMGRIKPVVP